MQYMKYFLVLFFLISSYTLFAQADSNRIVVHKDPRIDLLIKKQIEINEITIRNARRHMPGYRIQVISTNDRNKALDAKTKVYQRFPELTPYVVYQAPFFKIKVGNFKERSEAEKYLQDVQRIFSTGVYVVRDVIEVNPDKETDLQ